MKHAIKNKRGDDVGWWDNEENPRTYHTDRNYKLKQIFIHPKYNSAVGLDLRIIKKHLLPNKITRLDFLIINFEKETFHAYIELNDFLVKGTKINFSKKKEDEWWSQQIILSLNEFTRKYGSQTTLV
jgi:hypothetical protein|tara:strand:+ start:6131 stop:6511 length:381 start_codon:yes stop_codon:yes gene_type:complete